MSHAKQLHHRRYLNDYLEMINREGLPGNVKNELAHHVPDVVLSTVQQVIERALEEELSSYLGLERYEHLPWGVPQNSPAVGAISVNSLPHMARWLSCARPSGLGKRPS